MSNIVIFKPNQTPQYLTSVNTPDYSSDPDVIVNPDISAVQNIDRKYWKRIGNTVEAMTITEKQAVEDAIKAKRLQELNNYEFQEGSIVKILVEEGLTTKAHVIDIIKVMEGLI